MKNQTVSNDATSIPSGSSVLKGSFSREESFITGKVMVRYEMRQHPTYFSIKVFHAGQELPVTVHTGKRAYIDALWSKTTARK